MSQYFEAWTRREIKSPVQDSESSHFTIWSGWTVLDDSQFPQFRNAPIQSMGTARMILLIRWICLTTRSLLHNRNSYHTLTVKPVYHSDLNDMVITHKQNTTYCCIFHRGNMNTKTHRLHLQSLHLPVSYHQQHSIKHSIKQGRCRAG